MSYNSQASLRKNTRNALERLDSLEEQTVALVQAINEAFATKEKQISELNEVVDALVAVLGVEQVTAAVVANREKVAQARVEALKAGLAELVANGKVKQVDVVTEKSLLTGHYLGADGKVLQPGYVQVEVPALRPEIALELSGKSVPLEHKIDDATFVITGAYELVDTAASAE